MTTDASLAEIGAAAEARDELGTVARQVLERAWSPEHLRARLEGDGPAFDEGLWATVRDLGWCDVLVAEDAGGGGATFAELCVLAEEAGAAAAPVPLTAAAAAGWLDQRCVGSATPLLLDGHPVMADDGALSGRWDVVPYGAIATRFLTRATSPDGRQVLCAVDAGASGVTVTGVRPLDHGPAAAIVIDGAPTAVLTEGDEALTRWRTATQIRTLGTVAEITGVASAANAAATEYAKERVTFGRPIGTYQAIKHRLVDQRAAIEVSRALVTRAATACQREQPNADALTSLAAFWAIDALRAIPEGAIQVFGGIGYTWEHPAHVHLRRAACLTAMLGPRPDHRAAVMAWLAGRSCVA